MTESDLTRLVRRVISEGDAIATHPTFGDNQWVDKFDRSSNPDIEEYPEEKEFGPDQYEEFMDFINDCDTSWCIKTKNMFNRFAMNGPIKVRKRP